ncbi:MAG: HIT domain-containing protein [Thermoguttaceae bacterium]|nr:HIT domain-containing protein [Thermoguttaceae bacterium]
MNYDVLWAPWRMAYIKSDKKEEPRKVEVAPDGDPDCFICQAVADSTEYDRERLVVGRTATTIAILNRFPYNNGHLLIAPKRHIARLELLTSEESRDVMAELSYWVGTIEKAMNAEGFNVGLNLGRVAGAGLPGHMHWHIVPRWNGDASFITTIGSAKAIPQALEAAWETLRRE